MDLKIARALPNEKPKTTTLEKVEEALKEGQNFFYFDKENSHKDLLNLVKHFEKKGISIYHRVVKYGLDDDDFMYEVHIL